MWGKNLTPFLIQKLGYNFKNLVKQIWLTRIKYFLEKILLFNT